MRLAARTGKKYMRLLSSLKKPVALKTRDGGFRLEWSYGVATVFTPLKYRGKKIAAWMMRRFGEWFDSEEAK